MAPLIPLLAGGALAAGGAGLMAAGQHATRNAPPGCAHFVPEDETSDRSGDVSRHVYAEPDWLVPPEVA